MRNVTRMDESCAVAQQMQHTATRLLLRRHLQSNHTHTATYYSILPHTCCCAAALGPSNLIIDTLQHTAPHCNMLQHTCCCAVVATFFQYEHTHCNTLQHNYFNTRAIAQQLRYTSDLIIHTLQHTATHLLQYTYCCAAAVALDAPPIQLI